MTIIILLYYYNIGDAIGRARPTGGGGKCLCVCSATRLNKVQLIVSIIGGGTQTPTYTDMSVIPFKCQLWRRPLQRPVAASKRAKIQPVAIIVHCKK